MSFVKCPDTYTGLFFDTVNQKFLSCPYTGSIKLFGNIYTNGIDDASIKSAIENYYNVTVTFDEVTCTYTQTGGTGLLPADSKIPVEVVTDCKTINLALVSMITSSVCNPTPNFNDVTTFSENTRIITDNSSPILDISHIDYNIEIYNPDMTLLSNTQLLSNAAPGSSTPSFTLKTGQRYILTTVVTDTLGCKHFIYEHNTIFANISCFDTFYLGSGMFTGITSIQDSPYIIPAVSGISLGCDILGHSTVNGDYINVEACVRTLSPLSDSIITISNQTTAETYSFVLYGKNHIQLKNNAEILQYYPSGFKQGDVVQLDVTYRTVADVAAGTYARYVTTPTAIP